MDALSRIKSVIVTTSAEQRKALAQGLHAIGFPAEKITVDSLQAAQKALEDKEIGNVCIDASKVAGDLRAYLAEVHAALRNLPVHVVALLPEAQAALAKTLQAELSPVRLFALPLKRQDLVDALVTPRLPKKAAPQKPAAPIARSQPATGTAPAAKPKSALAGINEAVDHVRSTIEALKKLAETPGDLVALAAIGQRFNGVYGTFLFFGEREGYVQVRQMAEVIDAVAKTYGAKPKGTAVPKAHLELLMAVARCAFGLLKELRAGQPPSATQRAEAAKLVLAYRSDGELFQREALGQNAVDDLLKGA